MNKQYLGDAVYIESDQAEHGFLLTTSDGVTDTNTIYLEPEVALALVGYLNRALSQTSSVATTNSL